VNAAVIHAHPDDELLFAGGLMAHYPEWTWTLVSLTTNAQAPRYPGVVLGHDDVWRLLTMAEYREWKASLEGSGSPRRGVHPQRQWASTATPTT
jgi:hypothetical protein